MSNIKELFLVVDLLAESKLELILKDDALPLEVNVPLSWEHGQVGVMPVFSSLEDAQKYGGVHAQIITFSVNGDKEAEDFNEVE